MCRAEAFDNGDYIAMLLRRDCETRPRTALLMPKRKPTRRVSRDFVSGAVEYDQTEYEARMYFLRQAS